MWWVDGGTISDPMNEEAGGQETPPQIDRKALAVDLGRLGKSLKDGLGPKDIGHLRGLVWFGRACTTVGLATAWIAPNPLSIIALSTGRFGRWAVVGHHIIHGGYDKIDGPSSKTFGRGMRRFVDWFDTMLPEAWHQEHDLAHHYRLNEPGADPDLVEEKVDWLRKANWPKPFKVAIVAFFALTWKWSHVAPATLAEQWFRATKAPARLEGPKPFDPRHPVGRALWFKSLLPVFLLQFVLLPALFLPLGLWAAGSVLINVLLAEVLTNLHAFLMIVPNHVGGDLWRFEHAPEGKADYYLRQVIGSADYTAGGQLHDYMHGYLNYQVEHHLWPDLPPSALRRARPRVREVCAQHGVPFVEQSVWTRLVRTVKVMIGSESMKRWPVPPAATG